MTVVSWKTQSKYFCLFPPEWHIPAISTGMRHFHYRKRILCFSKTTTVSTERKIANTRRENEFVLVSAVSFCLSQTAEMNSCEWTPTTGLWPSWKWATFPTPLLENVFVHVVFTSLVSLFSFSYVPSFPPHLKNVPVTNFPISARFWHTER